MKLEAPYPAIQTITFLPNPEFNDSEFPTFQLQKNYTITGKVYTYIKTTDNRRKLIFQLKLSRLKALELFFFIKSYHSSQIRLTDHLNNQWVGYITINPFSFTTPGPEEMQEISLEFEGIKT